MKNEIKQNQGDEVSLFDADGVTKKYISTNGSLLQQRAGKSERASAKSGKGSSLSTGPDNNQLKLKIMEVFAFGFL
jgi:hypothetical protein